MRLDLITTPFSRRGSWLNFSRPRFPDFQPLGPGLYLRSNHHRPLVQRELFRVELRRGRGRAAFREVAEAHRLRLIPDDGEGEVVAIFDRHGSVRVRGRGVGIRFAAAIRPQRDRRNAAHFVAYDEGEGRCTVNARPSLRRYGFRALEGALSLDAPFEGEVSPHARIDCVPGESGAFEIAIDEYSSTWVEPERRPAFKRCLEEAEQEFELFVAAMPGLPRRWRPAGREAAYVLWSCTVAPCGQLARGAVFMSRNWMDQVWSWDNCFNAAALVHGHEHLAMDQFLVVADHQDEFGAYPDGLNDGFKHYNFSKPPVQGVLLDWIASRRRSFLTPARRRRLYRTVAAFTRWWLTHRRGPGSRLCHYLHGNDSGWDNASLLREGVPLVAPDLNAFLAVQCATLARLARRDGRSKAAADWNARAAELRRALLDELWTGDRFVGRLPHRDGAAVDAASLVTCMPLVLGRGLPDAVRRCCVKRLRRFVTSAGLATEEPASPCYEEDGYWRGPVWGPSTMLATIGLRRCGEEALARRIARRYLATCKASGFAENFAASDGAPLRDRAYTWTASAFLELARTWG